MATDSTQPKGRDRALSTLDTLIQIMDAARNVCGIPPAQAAFGSTSLLLTMIRDTMPNKKDYVELGRSCGHVCQALDRGLRGRRSDDLSQSVLEAIGQLTVTLAEIKGKVNALGKRNPFSRSLRSKNDKDAIAAWGRDLDRILNIFNTELLLNNHTILLDIRRNTLAGQEGTDGRRQSTHSSIPLGELPPPPPRACFGRSDLIEKIVGLAKRLNPVALIGPGGIGKTSVALAVLHSDRIKDRFGDNRRFIRCDQFTASCTNFLSRLSEVIGAGVENPVNLAPLRPILSSKEMFIVLDNAESILDPQGTDGQEIYGVVKELSQFDGVCLCITSRITTVPPDCETIEIPTLLMEAARDAFYRIYKYGGQSDPVDNILGQLDFHPLSVTLLATVAHQNKWDNNRLVREWERHKTGMLQTEHNESLAVAIELSLASPMFQRLGPDARGLLEVVAFFPQGIDENKLDWLFPTISNRHAILDKLCILSLTYRSNGFITMLAPLRDHLRPKEPMKSTLLCATKDLYTARLTTTVDPALPGFGDTQWIASEDVNIEHLLNVFTSADPDSDIWDSCNGFMGHLYWHKRRQTVLGPKVEQLPDNHFRKPRGLLELSRLFDVVGNHVEQKRLLNHALKLWRERRDDYWVARALHSLASANQMLGLCEEGIQQAREALGVYERLGIQTDQVWCLNVLSHLLLEDKQFDAAEEAITRSLNLMDGSAGFPLCQAHRILGDVFRCKGEREKAVHHYNIALEIASPPKWHDQLFWIQHSLTILFRDEGKLDDAHTHIRQAKRHALHDKFYQGFAMEVEARIWYREGRHKDGVAEILRAIEVFEKLEAARDLDRCRAFLQVIERAMEESFGESDFSGGLLEIDLLPAPVNLPLDDGSSSSTLFDKFEDTSHQSGPVFHPCTPSS